MSTDQPRNVGARSIEDEGGSKAVAGEEQARHAAGAGATSIGDRAGELGLNREAVLQRQQERYGGIKPGSAFFGWLTATGTAVLLTALLAAAGAAVGVATHTDVGQAVGQATQNATTVGITGGIVLLVILFLAYFAGGYVAG